MRGSRRKGRRPGTWELRIDAGLDPLTGRRRQRSVVFEGTAREADAKLADLTVEAGRGRVQSGAHSLSELLERGLEQAASEGLERPTLRGYRRVAENQIVPALGARRITKITAEDLDTFYRALAKKGYSQARSSTPTPCGAGCSTPPCDGGGSATTPPETPGRPASPSRTRSPFPPR